MRRKQNQHYNFGLFISSWNPIKILNIMVLFIGQEVDTDAPYCVISGQDGDCTGTRYRACSTLHWSMEFDALEGQSGISMIRPRSSVGNGTFQVDGDFQGSNHSIHGSYRASCCFPNVTILVVDGFGNIASCGVELETFHMGTGSASTNLNSTSGIIMNSLLVVILVLFLYEQ